VDKGEDGRAWSTRDRCECYLDTWIETQWGTERLDAIVAGPVEEWLEQLRRKPRKGEDIPVAELDEKGLVPLAAGMKEKIRDLMERAFQSRDRLGNAGLLAYVSAHLHDAFSRP
jgi:hypothetical protein